MSPAITNTPAAVSHLFALGMVAVVRPWAGAGVNWNPYRDVRDLWGRRLLDRGFSHESVRRHAYIDPDGYVHLLTSRESGIVAISLEPKGRQELLGLPRTGAVLDTADGEFLIYQHPGTWIEPGVVPAGTPPNGALVSVYGDRTSLIVPKPAYPQLIWWSHRRRLPVFDWAWLARPVPAVVNESRP